MAGSSEYKEYARPHGSISHSRREPGQASDEGLDDPGVHYCFFFVSEGLEEVSIFLPSRIAVIM